MTKYLRLLRTLAAAVMYRFLLFGGLVYLLIDGVDPNGLRAATKKTRR